MSLTYDLSRAPWRRVYRGVCRWTRFSLLRTRTAGLAAVSDWLLGSRSFSGFAMTALALLSMNARPVNDTRSTFQFSNFIVYPMKSHPGGFPSSVLPSAWPETRRIDRPVSSRRRWATRYRPRLPSSRMRSMLCAGESTPRTGFSGRTRRLDGEILAPPRVRLATCPFNQLALQQHRN